MGLYYYWSYDWYVPEDEIVYDSFNFMFTDHSTDMNFTGFTERQLNITGYGIVFDAELPQIRLFKWLVLSDSVTTNYDNLASVNSFSSEPIAVMHHIDITRNTDSRIRVFLDKELKIDKTDTTHSTSEFFCWASFKGDSYIDNLVVSDQIVEPDPTDDPTDNEDDGIIHFWLVPVSILVMVVYRRVTKK